MQIPDKMRDRRVDIPRQFGRGVQVFRRVEYRNHLAVENDRGRFSVARPRVDPESVGANERHVAPLSELDLLAGVLNHIVAALPPNSELFELR